MAFCGYVSLLPFFASQLISCSSPDARNLLSKILQSDPGIANGPGHHSILQIPGTDDWYIAYHRHPLGDTDGNHRKLAIDRLYFDANGDILPIQMTANGVAPIPTHAQPGR